MTSIPSPAGPLQLLDFRSARPPAALRLAGSNGGETTGRGLRRIAVEAPRDWRPPNPSPMNLSLEGRNPLRPLPRTGKFRRIFRARQSPAIPHWRLSFRLAAPPASLRLAGSNRDETSCGGGLVSSAAARRRFSQARPGSPANRLRHSTSAGSGYTQLPVIRKGNVRKLAGGSDPAGVEPPAAQSGTRSPHSKVAPSMRRRWEKQLGDRDSEFPTHSLRRRSLRQGLRRSLRRGLSRKQLFASLFRELRRELCRINTSRKICHQG